MKLSIALLLALVAEHREKDLCVHSETCNRVSDCRETMCGNQDGWWLHCTKGMCLCTHDSFIGKPCTDGNSDTCVAIHDTRCTDHNLRWRCIDQTCHCAKY